MKIAEIFSRDSCLHVFCNSCRSVIISAHNHSVYCTQHFYLIETRNSFSVYDLSLLSFNSVLLYNTTHVRNASSCARSTRTNAFQQSHPFPSCIVGMVHTKHLPGNLPSLYSSQVSLHSLYTISISVTRTVFIYERTRIQYEHEWFRC